MTDQTIPADEVRKIIAFYRDGASDRGGMILDALRNLLPPPPPPTLADMTEEERAECRWMQCDYGEPGHAQSRGVIGYFSEVEGKAVILTTKCGILRRDYDRVTPLPDLPRLTWPGDQQPAPALPEGWRLADHKHYGRVIVTNPTPDVGGHVYFVSPAPSPIGNDWHLCPPDELTFLDQEDADAVD